MTALSSGSTPRHRGLPVRLLYAAVVIVALSALSVLVAPTPGYADRIRGAQWQLGQLHAAAAWKYADGRGVTVAVLDSGVDASHPDLDDRVLPGADLVDGEGDGRSDEVGHGTAVATLIAGRDDASGVVGLAPHARILPVRVLDRKNRYRDAATVARGLRWAVAHGAQVVNLSLGGTLQSPDLAEAIQYAYDHDVVVVACAGNAGPGDERVWYPAREPGVIAVTGLNRDGTFWKRSLAGRQSVLSAPAAGLVAGRPGGYWKVEGTSFAAPLVSATAALIRSHWPDMTAANVVNRLIRTARDLGPVGRDDRYGFGEIDPVGALTTPVTSVSGNPLDTTPRTSPSQPPSRRPTIRAAGGHHRTRPWWWLGFGIFTGGGLAAVLTSLAVLRRRG